MHNYWNKFIQWKNNFWNGLFKRLNLFNYPLYIELSYNGNMMVPPILTSPFCPLASFFSASFATLTAGRSFALSYGSSVRGQPSRSFVFPLGPKSVRSPIIYIYIYWGMRLVVLHVFPVKHSNASNSQLKHSWMETSPSGQVGCFIHW